MSSQRSYTSTQPREPPSGSQGRRREQKMQRPSLSQSCCLRLYPFLSTHFARNRTGAQVSPGSGSAQRISTGLRWRSLVGCATAASIPSVESLVMTCVLSWLSPAHGPGRAPSPRPRSGVRPRARASRSPVPHDDPCSSRMARASAARGARAIPKRCAASDSKSRTRVSSGRRPRSTRVAGSRAR